jgi:hypothetical protein
VGWDFGKKHIDKQTSTKPLNTLEQDSVTNPIIQKQTEILGAFASRVK